MSDAPDIPDRSERGGLARYEPRYKWFVGVVLVALSILLVRVWYLQIYRGDRYFRVSTDNVVRTVEIDPPRGRMFDRAGVPLATNRTAYTVRIIPHVLRESDVEQTLTRLQQHLNLSDERVGVLRRKVDEKNSAVVVRRDVSRKRVARIETDKMRLPGVEIRVDSRRYYPLDSVFAHTLGFMGQIDAEELREWDKYGYRGGDFVGQMGLEEAFEPVLHGSPGEKREVVNAQGIAVEDEDSPLLEGRTRRVEPVPGRDLHLTLDADLQLAVDRAMERESSGAVVAVDPDNGDVLALYSKPTFNPNAWSGKLSSSEKMRTENDPFKPMLDKTVRPYFPGSVFKIVSAEAGLKAGVIELGEEKACPGYYRFGGRLFRCWNLAGHGDVDLRAALMHSCDVYFYKMATELGMAPMADEAFDFGFGEETGLPHNDERPGRVPTRKWHEKHSPNGYQQGFALNLVLGQGNMMATPVQVALAYAAIANGGSLYYPRLVREITDGRGEVLFRAPSQVRRELDLAESHLKAIREGLWKVVNEEGGTAYDMRHGGLSVAGKTGTAQVHTMGRRRVPNREKLVQNRDHAWFVGYAPEDDPEVVVVVFLEHAGHGGRQAAPIAMDIFEDYLHGSDEESLTRKIGRELRNRRSE